MTSTPSTKERAQDAASTAADEGKHVAGIAKDEAQNVASEAISQARGLIDQALAQVDEQSRSQRDRLVTTLRSLGEDLDEMAEQASSSGLATDLAREIAQRARAISSRLDGRETNEILDDLRSFARRRPGTFLLGALAAGVVVGRVARGAKAAQSSEPSAPSGAGGGFEPVGSPSGQPVIAPPTEVPDSGTSLYGGPTPPETRGSAATTPSYGQSEIAAPPGTVPGEEGLSGGPRP